MNNALQFYQAIDRLDLVSPTIKQILKNSENKLPLHELMVAEIDPAFAGGDNFCKQYGISVSEGANCVVVEAIRGDKRLLAACVAPVNCRIDFNGIVKKIFNVRRVSLAPLNEILAATQMEYGSVTPIGLPTDWPVLLDERVADAPQIIIGAGLVKAKLALPGKVLAKITSAKIIAGLGI